MSGTEAFPPPGSSVGSPPEGDPESAQWTAPENTQWSAPGSPPPPPPGWHVPVAYAAHKPGAIPLRPLALGDFYNGAFKIIRVNPGATVGSAALVSTVAMAIPLLIGAALVATYDLGTWTDTGMDETELLADTGSIVTSLMGSLLQSFGLIFVTAMVAQVVVAATLGRKLSLGEAWAATGGVRLRLVGLSFVLGAAYLLLIALYVLAWVLVVLADVTALIVVWGLVTVPLFVCGLVWVYVRVYYFATPVLMVERTSITGAVRRGYALTADQFWRTFGIALLTAIITAFASGILSVPASLLGLLLSFAVEGNTGVFLMLVLQSLGTVLASAFVAPFTSAVTTLQYVDQRIRKEAYDVELLTQAGLPTT